MHWIDWAVIGIFCSISIILGMVLTKKASEGMESYFASDRSLGWWLAGTSMAATAFSSDTPLLITGIVRRKGIWGNWEVWALAISTMLAVFVFSKLWKRAGVLTEVELVELRYSGRSAAFLRGFKALYWGIFYNAFIMGAWPMTGLVKVMHETTDWSKAQSIFFCMGLVAVYSALSGYWGVILTDMFQFLIAMAGAFILAFYSIRACGGIDVIIDKLGDTGKLAVIPPMHGGSLHEIAASPFGWFLGLLCIQWWAWKNADGGGIIVQRIASCKNEKQAIYATLWFNIAQYALRAWPWILTALASLVLLPDLADHEAAYPKLISMLLPTGLRGLMVASFFAAFMSTMSTHLNWGSSYFVNDFYKRFVKRNASEQHYVGVARLTSLALAAGATGVAFMTDNIGAVFSLVLNLTAAIGPVYLLRWFWWRINPASEITALAVSLPVLLVRPWVLSKLGIGPNPPLELLFMVAGAAIFWVPATFMVPQPPFKVLKEFFKRVRPPGNWEPLGKHRESWAPSLLLWLVSTSALLGTAIGPLLWILKRVQTGVFLTAGSAALWVLTAVLIRKKSEIEAPEPEPTLSRLS